MSIGSVIAGPVESVRIPVCEAVGLSLSRASSEERAGHSARHRLPRSPPKPPRRRQRRRSTGQRPGRAGGRLEEKLRVRLVSAPTGRPDVRRTATAALLTSAALSQTSPNRSEICHERFCLTDSINPWLRLKSFSFSNSCLAWFPFVEGTAAVSSEIASSVSSRRFCDSATSKITARSIRARALWSVARCRGLPNWTAASKALSAVAISPLRASIMPKVNCASASLGSSSQALREIPTALSNRSLTIKYHANLSKRAAFAESTIVASSYQRTASLKSLLPAANLAAFAAVVRKAI